MSKVPSIGSAPPTRSARAKCWAARDDYFNCLDQSKLWLHGLGPTSHEDILAVDPIELKCKTESDRSLSREERSRLFACKKFKEIFDKECLPSWSSHFSMLRVKDLQKDYIIETVEQSEREREANDDEFWKKVSAKPQ
ncbi:uncharacterized protein BJ171DRAFT_117275 [Polychytrium aggregatum]|uniref:uncharacterized protein n=1 Tax=Polychytrium aggregatum TaxID=110093 RepID=UPI0022FDEA5E|nr:uncharacterized protein BJ171DRAFT_117275 [Polychytrium aggregatum]KAI9209416.1 hypothetical protein BJ171DRAFT_117275 [Polychytrium aggregatum]